MKITNYHEDYHRNGSGGQGFLVAFFHAEGDDGQIDDDFIAIMWTGEDEDDVDRVTEAAVLRHRDIVEISQFIGKPRDYAPWWTMELPAWRGTDRFLPFFPTASRLPEEERRRVQAQQRSGTYGWYEASPE